MTVDLEELRQRVAALEGRAGGAALPVHPALAGLVALRAGGVYGVDAASLLTTVLAGPSAHGAWCGIVGSADLGLEAAAEAGLDLSRTVLVPDPGDAWLEVTAALVDVLGIVAVRPPRSVRPGDASRLTARLRTRGSALVVWGEWPRCDARLSLVRSHWSGVGAGHGRLVARRAVLEVRQGAGPVRRSEVWWPAADLVAREVEPPLTAPTPIRRPGMRSTA
ncbi:hypothetical protein HMPREF0063_12269 [Aeromicrobium marinum DSM 15272]|uniref:Protein ImuA n=1 Tax=Aeromicrobium marinum DSM 15272 TaxID=585531 RepID=E2SCV7_9ACTN|nr:hypothetical protein [Aeromicrobium marinum]EFQ83060.1 hypothetical protein HMPREF0063_12269 [Aeromicrobium marinum DSM 15272]